MWQVYEEFCSRAADITSRLRQGAASGAEHVDCGSMCMPGQAQAIQQLIDDAVAKGAKVGSLKMDNALLSLPPN